MTTDAQRLQEVEDAIHRLMTGQQEAAISSNGHSVSYVPADLPALRAEKRRLEASTGQRRPRRSIRPYF